MIAYYFAQKRLFECIDFQIRNKCQIFIRLNEIEVAIHIKIFLYIFLCLDPLYQGAFENKCMVSRDGNEISQMCVRKDQQSRCGTKTENSAVCCCNTPNCNNDAFVNNCKTGTTPTRTTPTSSPKGFTCIGKQPGSTIKNDIECSSMCSGIYIFGFLNIFYIF